MGTKKFSCNFARELVLVVCETTNKNNIHHSWVGNARTIPPQDGVFHKINMIELNNIYHGDCLELMVDIPDCSIDAIICDLPYETTPCKWDKMIPLDKLWAHYKRIIKPTGAIVLFCQQPFTNKLMSSNIEMWKYNWIWMKDNGTNFLNSHHQPIKITEDIAVFGFASTSPSSSDHMTYNPQMSINAGKAYKTRQGNRTTTSVISSLKGTDVYSESNGDRYPTNIIYFKRDISGIHPTAKPVDLLRYLVLTYTNEGDTVLDNCMGVGATILACIREKRNYIGMEINDKFFNEAKKRINLELRQPKLF